MSSRGIYRAETGSRRETGLSKSSATDHQRDSVGRSALYLLIASQVRGPLTRLKEESRHFCTFTRVNARRMIQPLCDEASGGETCGV